MATTLTKRIIVKVDTGESKAAIDSLAKQFGLLGKNTKSLAGNMGLLANAFRGWLGYIGIRELVSMSDSMQNLDSKLRIVTGSAEGAQEAFRNISGIADRTSRSLEDVGQTYTRFSNALKDTGATIDEMTALTETLINTFRVSGTNAAAAAGGVLQLSQSFTKGKLDGDEFRTVLESNAVLSRALKKEYGQDLFKKAKDGAIGVTDVLRVLARIQGDVNNKAKLLRPTFEDTLTKAMNKVAIQIKQLNEEFALSTKFATLMGVAVENLGTIITVVASVALPFMIRSFAAFAVSLSNIVKLNPVLFILSSIATIGILIYQNWNELPIIITKAMAKLLEFAAILKEVVLIPVEGLNTALGGILDGQLRKAKEGIVEMQVRANQLRQSVEVYGPPEPTQDQNRQTLLDSLADRQTKAKEAAKSLKGELAELNNLYLSGQINLQEYNKRLIDFNLGKVNRQFKEGSTDIFKYHEQLMALEIQETERQFNRGAISLEEFNRGISNSRLSVLNEQVRAGRIGLAEYNEELTKLEDMTRPGAGFYSGVSDFIKSAGTLSEGIARATSQAFGHLSDTLTTFIQTGKLQFADFTRAILNDLTAMLVRAAIVRPIAQGILGFFDGASAAPAGVTTDIGSGGVGAYTAAKGGVMTDMGMVPLQKYASGGVANSPQMAIFGEGRTPEAYVPLPDGRNIPVKMDGGGGVSVVQNITINSDGSATSSDQSTGRAAKQLADMMKRVAVDTIIQQQRPGGVLA